MDSFLRIINIVILVSVLLLCPFKYTYCVLTFEGKPGRLLDLHHKLEPI